MSVTEADVRKVAELARVAVPDAELPALASELSSILGWVEQLNEVDVTGVEPMASSVDLQLPMRADEARHEDLREQVLANAPESREGFFVVPKVVE